MEENVIQINGEIKPDKSTKNTMYVKKDYIWNPAPCSCGNGKYLASIMDDSAITCDEIIESYDEETKTIPKNFNEQKATCKTQNFYILLAFLLITVELMLAASIYCYLLKYLTKEKYLLPFHVANNELKRNYVSIIQIKSK